MRKPKKTSWKDTNLALIGSDLDKKIKEAAAKGEPQWTDVGNTVQLKIWRIEQFVVKPWPKFKYGRFHTGDSYVVCNSYKPDPDKPKIAHDIHIWIGDESTQDEYGTAAYKMTELDAKLGGIAVHHREIQKAESEQFLNYFNGKVIYLAGGVDSGFHHVDASDKEPHLYRVKGTCKSVAIWQVPVRRDSMNGGDVFILVAGAEKVWLWCGVDSNKDERAQGLKVARDFCAHDRVKTLDQGQNDGEDEAKDFWKYLPKHISQVKRSLKIKKGSYRDSLVGRFNPVLYKLANDGSHSFQHVANARMIRSVAIREPKFKRYLLQQQHAYLLDTGFHIFIWLGKEAAASVKHDAVSHVHSYIEKHKRPELPLTILKAGFETARFNNFFYDGAESLPPASPATNAKFIQIFVSIGKVIGDRLCTKVDK